MSLPDSWFDPVALDGGWLASPLYTSGDPATAELFGYTAWLPDAREWLGGETGGAPVWPSLDAVREAIRQRELIPTNGHGSFEVEADPG